MKTTIQYGQIAPHLARLNIFISYKNHWQCCESREQPYMKTTNTVEEHCENQTLQRICNMNYDLSLSYRRIKIISELAQPQDNPITIKI